MKTIEAQVVDCRHLRLAKPVNLKNGDRVRVTISPSASKSTGGRRGLLASLRKIRIEGPVDFSRKVDEHIYGAIK